MTHFSTAYVGILEVLCIENNGSALQETHSNIYVHYRKYHIISHIPKHISPHTDLDPRAVLHIL